MAKINQKKILIVLAIVLSIPLFLYIQLNWISVTKEEIYISHLPKTFEEFKAFKRARGEISNILGNYPIKLRVSNRPQLMIATLKSK